MLSLSMSLEMAIGSANLTELTTFGDISVIM